MTEWYPEPPPAPIGEMCIMCHNNKSEGAVYEKGAPNPHWRFHYHSCLACASRPERGIDGKSRIIVPYLTEVTNAKSSMTQFMTYPSYISTDRDIDGDELRVAPKNATPDTYITISEDFRERYGVRESN